MHKHHGGDYICLVLGGKLHHYCLVNQGLICKSESTRIFPTMKVECVTWTLESSGSGIIRYDSFLISLEYHSSELQPP